MECLRSGVPGDCRGLRLSRRTSRATFHATRMETPQLKAFLDQRPGDYRIFYQRTPNIAMWLGKEDVWGYAPLVLKRYTEFMAFTQGQSPEGVTYTSTSPDSIRFTPCCAGVTLFSPPEWRPRTDRAIAPCRIFNWCRNIA